MFLWGADVPADSGFARFGVYHLSWLLLTVLVSFAPIGRTWNAGKRQKISRWFTVWMSGSDVVRMLILAYKGQFSVYVLPFHLCSLAIWLCLLHAWSGAEWVGQILYILCLPGAVSALLFPDWVAYPPYNYFCIHSFFVHSATVCYVLRKTRAGVIRPRLRGVVQSVAFLCVLVPVMLVFNRTFGTNYLFLCAAPAGSPLVLLWDALGEDGYLVGFAALVFLMMLGMLGLYRLVRRFGTKKE